MADPTRFPDLCTPFALTGGVAAWLWTQQIGRPFSDAAAVHACVALLGAAGGWLAGRVAGRLCLGRRYAYEIVDTTDARLPSDGWDTHAAVVVTAGALVGATACVIFDDLPHLVLFSVNGGLCGALFAPVFLSVVKAARFAQRARSGSLVSGSDRRAVWSTLAITIAPATLLAFPMRFMAERVWGGVSIDAIAILLGCGALVAGVLRRDLDARHQASVVVAANLRHPDELEDADGTHVPQFDLGVGDDVLAAVAPAASAYRHRARAAVLVLGRPDVAVHALDVAVRRGKWGLCVVVGVGALHALATVDAVIRWVGVPVGLVLACAALLTMTFGFGSRS